MRKTTALLIGLFAVIMLVLGAVLPNGAKQKKDPKAGKPTYQVGLIFDEAYEYENYIACPSCGDTYYMHAKLTLVGQCPVVDVVFWSDFRETQKKRRHIFGNNDPFDPFGQWRPEER